MFKQPVRLLLFQKRPARDLIAYYGLAPERIIAIHHGVHEMFHPLDDHSIASIHQKYHIRRPYFLCVGTLQRRKNIPRLIQAFYLLKQKCHLPHTLVLIGQNMQIFRNEIFVTIERLFLDEEVLWTGYVPAQDYPH